MMRKRLHYREDAVEVSAPYFSPRPKIGRVILHSAWGDDAR